MARNCSKVRAARAARLLSLIQPMNLILNLWGRRCCSRRDAEDNVVQVVQRQNFSAQSTISVPST